MFAISVFEVMIKKEVEFKHVAVQVDFFTPALSNCDHSADLQKECLLVLIKQKGRQEEKLHYQDLAKGPHLFVPLCFITPQLGNKRANMRNLFIGRRNKIGSCLLPALDSTTAHCPSLIQRGYKKNSDQFSVNSS